VCPAGLGGASAEAVALLTLQKIHDAGVAAKKGFFSGPEIG
jgi:hypothetical protein